MLGEADAGAKPMPLAMDYRVLKNASIRNTGHGTQVPSKCIVQPVIQNLSPRAQHLMPRLRNFE